MLEVKISDEAEQDLQEIAAQKGMNAIELATEFLEKEIAENKLANGTSQLKIDETERAGENPFAPFIAMFSSGKTDTSSRYKEILKEEIDQRGGFGGS